MTQDKLMDEGALISFYDLMRDKMTEQRDSGRAGWFDSTVITYDALQQMLKQNFYDEDWIDVANIAMMLHFRSNP